MYLYLAVLRLIQKNFIVQAWYQCKIERDGGTKMKAVWIYPIGAPPDFEATHVRDLLIWSCENCSLSPRLGIQFGEVEIGISCAQRIVAFQKSGWLTFL